MRNQLPDLSDLSAPRTPKSPRANVEALPDLADLSEAAPTTAAAPPASWSRAGDAGKVKDFFRTTFGRDLPVTAEGQSRTHDRMGFDHRDSLDVGLHPASDEGRALIEYLTRSNIPFRAFDRAVPGAATGPHIHVGFPSRRGAAPMQLREMPDLTDLAADDDEEEVIRVNASTAVAEPPVPPRPPAEFNIHTTEGRAARDAQRQQEAAPAARRVMNVSLPAGKTDWSEVTGREAMREAVRRFGEERDISPEFLEKWLARNGDALHIYDLRSGERREPVDLIGTPDFDERTRSLRIAAEMPLLRRMEEEYKASRGTAARLSDWAGDPTRTAGEKFLDVAQPVAEAGAVAADYAGRPLGAVDAYAWSKLRGMPDALAGVAAERALRGEEQFDYAKNPAAEAARESETLRDINPNLPGIAGAVAEAVTSPSNLLPVGAVKYAGELASGTRAGARVADALDTAGDTRFARASRVLDTAAPVPESPATLRAQFRSAIDPESPRAAVLVTPGEQVKPPPSFAVIPVGDAGTLHLNRLKARDLGLTSPVQVQEFIARNGFEPLIGKVSPVEDTSRGISLRTEDAAGRELSTSVVTGPDAARKQAAVDHAQFPEAVKQELMPTGEAAARRLDETSPAGTLPGPAAFPVDRALFARSPYGDLDPQDVLRYAAEDQRGRLTELARLKASAAKGVNPVSGAPLSPRGHGLLQKRIVKLKAEAARAGELVEESFGRAASDAFDQRAGAGLPTSFRYDPRAGERGAVNVSEVAAGVRRAASKDTLLDLINAPRAIKSSVDLSAPFRQGAIQTLTEPRAAVKAMRDMFRAALREGNFDAAVRSIAAHPDGALARESGLYFATKEAAQPLAKNMPRALSRREEAFMSRIASGLPLVKQSERAYTVYLDRLRMEAFSKYADELRAAGAADPKEFRDVAHWLNLATGRGDVGDWGKDGGAILNAAFFSPRYTASRFQVLNPVMYARMAPAARRIAMRKVVRYAGTIGSTLLLAKMGGAEVNLTDPSRPDWLKIKVGNTYYDPGSGLQQTMRFVYRMGLAFGRYRRGEKAKSNDHAINVLGSFARTKLAPVPGAAVNVLQGKNVVGEKATPGGEAIKLIIPLMAEDLYDAYQREGFTGAAKTTPALLGVGVQTYERKSPGGAASRPGGG